MTAAAEWTRAVRHALRGATGAQVIVDVADTHTTVRLRAAGDDGQTIAVATIQRSPSVARPDARQLTIDDVLARGAKPAAAAPAADTPPAPPARSPATVADDLGADLGEDGREYPDGEPYAELRVLRGDWLHYRRALGDVVGGAHHGDWRPDGDHRTLVVSRSQLDRIRAALGVHAHFLGVTLLAENLRTGQLWVSASEWMSLSPEARDELANHVQGAWRREGDWYTATPYEDAGGYVYDKLCREGVAVHLEPPPEPAPAKKPAKASKKLYRDQGHALDAPHAHPNTAHLVIRVAEGASPQTHLRPAGLDDAAWRRVCAGHVGDAVDAYGGIAVARLYSAKGKCLWDSRDSGAP